MRHQLSPLNFLLGKWKTRGEVAATTESAAIKFHGTDTYELILGDRFIEHRVDVMMGEARMEALELIGEYDEESKTWQMRSFDNSGAFTTMQAKLNEDGSLEILGDKMRSRLSVNSDNSMSAHWEISEDGEQWKPWMDLTLSR
jgi:hypothetical protein